MQLRHEAPALGAVPLVLGALAGLGGVDLGDALAPLGLELRGGGLHLGEAAAAVLVKVSASVVGCVGVVGSVCGGFAGGGDSVWRRVVEVVAVSVISVISPVRVVSS